MLRFAILLLLLTSSAARALPARDASFSHLTTREGLSHDSITALWQDDEGFLWVGTSSGLNRLDGQRVLPLRAGTPGLAHPQITCLQGGPDGALWVGTHDGVSRLDRRTQRLRSQGISGDTSALRNHHIAALALTRDGALWVGGARGLDRLDPGSGATSAVLTGLRVEHLLPEPDGALLVASPNRLLRLAPHTGSQSPLAVLPRHQRVRALLRAEDGAVWLAASGEQLLLGRRDPRSGAWRWFTSTTAPRRLEALALAEDHEGGIFVGTSDGLWHLDPQTGTLAQRYRHHPRLADGIPGEAVPVLLRDRQQGLWLGSYTGLGRLDLRPPRFTRHRAGVTPEEGLLGEQVWSLLEDRDGSVWVGTSQGLTRLPREASTATQARARAATLTQLAVGFVRALYQDAVGRLYAATHEGLLILEDGSGARRTWLRHDPQDPGSLPADRLSVLLEDQGGAAGGAARGLFVGSSVGGLAWLDLVTHRARRYPCEDDQPAALPCRINALAAAAQGLLWVGTMQGLMLFDPRRGALLRTFMHQQQDPRSLSRTTVVSLHRGRDGSLWVGTSAGLNHLSASADPAHQPAEFQRHVTPQLPDDFINGIAEDRAGRLWLTSNDGLLRLCPRSGAVQRFDTLDGLASNEFNQGAVATTRHGEVLVGGPRGCNRFDPAALTPDLQPPVVRITALRLNGQPVAAPPGELPLSAGMRKLELDFSVLGFDRPQRSRAAYRMEGLDSEWTESPAAGSVTYGPLPPGRYRFQVRGANADGIWNLEGAALSLSVQPVWWRTPWALCALALSSAFLLHRGHRLRVEQLRRRSAQLEVRVAERTEALSRSQQAALAAGQAKSDFLALMSHEIRTPLNAIIGLTGLLQETAQERGQVEMLRTIRSSGDLLLSLINDILDFSKIESGKLELRPATVVLRDSVAESLALLQGLAQQKGLALRLDLDAAVPQRVRLDATRLRQVLINLVGNAIKFTERGEVAVQVRARPAGDDHELEVTVRDSGPGVPVERRGALFQPFVQADPTLSRRGSGTGLGLVICRRLCELMGGRIWLDEAPGAGATFVFTVHAQEAEAQVAPASAPAPAGALGLNVLLCEDQPTNQWVTQRMLHHLDCTVTVVSDGVRGLQAAQAERFDVILMDVMMPEMDGLEATRRIRALGPQVAPGGRPWIIAMSAGALPDEQRRCREAGMDDFLAKPARLEDLAQALQRARGQLGVGVMAAPQEEPPRDEGIEVYLARLEAELPGMRQELVAELLGVIPERLGQLRAAGAAADWDSVTQASHGAKGVVGFIGATQLAARFAAVEKAARGHDGGLLETHMSALQHEAERVCAVLRGLAAAR